MHLHILMMNPLFFSVTQVAESFLELVTDETKDGEALIVLPDGTSYMKFPVLG